MAYEASQPLKHTFVAGEDLSAKRYHFVKISADNTIVACSGVTDVPIGVLQSNPASGQEAEVVISGITKVVADEALTAGDAVGTSADGQAQVVTVGTETTVYLAGRVIAGAGAAGRVATAVIDCAAAGRAA